MDWGYFSQIIPDMGSTVSMLLYGLSIVLAAAGMAGCVLPTRDICSYWEPASALLLQKEAPIRHGGYGYC